MKAEMLNLFFSNTQKGPTHKLVVRIFLQMRQKIKSQMLLCSPTVCLSIILSLLVYLTSVLISMRFTKSIPTDWHDYKSIEMEKHRIGLGENGMEAFLPPTEASEKEELFKLYGYNALLSARISVNRSVNDIRPPECWNIKYLSDLPSVSIIIIFYNEHPTTLLRTVHSIINRTPAQLVHEIILVDDASNYNGLGSTLNQYIGKHFSNVNILRLRKRNGLIRARLAGARKATSGVLLFLDAHCEVNANWLPPLLDPIAKNYKTVMCPFIDSVHYETFKYEKQDDGARGAFDWTFDYKRLNRLPEDAEHPWKIFQNPIMSGGLFAISADFFWELGGYDEGLEIWGGEQYELSFKIWMCGGEIYDAPCSRVGHIFRDFSPSSDDVSDLFKNYKRVAEVWMDEYKEHLYRRQPVIYNRTDTGDLTKQKDLRAKLKCKPFKWFLQEIAFDLERHFPAVEVPNKAYGFIQSASRPDLCAQIDEEDLNSEVFLSSCPENLSDSDEDQLFRLTQLDEINVVGTDACWDVDGLSENLPVTLFPCHAQRGNQLWNFDSIKNWITHEDYCLEYLPDTLELVINPCDEKNERMLWNFSILNETALGLIS